MSAPLERILIVRLGAMGDVIHALPAAAELRAAFPKSEIGWVIEDNWMSLLTSRPAAAKPRSAGKPLVDRVHVVNTHGWRAAKFSDETWKQVRRVVRMLRAPKYQLAVDFQGAWKSGLFARLSGARHRMGFEHTREGGARMFYTGRVAAQGEHVIEQNLWLARAIASKFSAEPGAARSATGADLLPRDTAVETWCEHAMRTRGFRPGTFAIINPGAGWGAKCWPAERYAEVARALKERGLGTFVNFGPAEEGLARQVESLSAGVATAMACSVGELIAITRRARMFIGGDTGPMHLAALLGVPVVGIFGPTDPARNGPFATESVVLRSAESVTNHSRRAGPDEAMLAIGAEEVLAAASVLLERTASRFARDAEEPHA